MRSVSRYLLVILMCGSGLVALHAQCPDRPSAGSIVKDGLSLSSQNGVLDVPLTMRHSVDTGGYSHYCMNYKTDKGDVEAPTLRLNQGDRLIMHMKNRIESSDSESGGMMDMGTAGQKCGD